MSADTTSRAAIAAPVPTGFVRRSWPWLAAVVVALVIPWLFFDWDKHRHSGFVLTMLSEIGLMSVFALSFNMQMGQAGLLSFGHAILFGLGSYCTAHTLNAIKAGTIWLPTELVPLAGGLGGLVFGALFGYVATKQRATAFAMITMGLGELVAACALMFMGFFGGEGGISTDRVIDTSLFGVPYTSPWQVYCLIVAWTAIAAFLMRLQTQTPLGRMANATRDNFERAQFVGYDPRMVRFYQFTLSGFFAGIGGALYVLVYEIVTFDTVAAAKSATALLATYIGGAGSFFGPLIGTIVDQVSLAMSGAGSQLERMPDMMAMAFFLRRAVYIAQVSGLASWLCVWVVLISNCSWQAANGTGVPTYTVPVVLVALGFFVADKAHLALMLAGRGCAVNSVTRRELMTSVGLLACIAIISFCGLV